MIGGNIFDRRSRRSRFGVLHGIRKVEYVTQTNMIVLDICYCLAIEKLFSMEFCFMFNAIGNLGSLLKVVCCNILCNFVNWLAKYSNILRKNYSGDA